MKSCNCLSLLAHLITHRARTKQKLPPLASACLSKLVRTFLPRALRLKLETAPPALFRAPLPDRRPKHEPHSPQRLPLSPALGNLRAFENYYILGSWAHGAAPTEQSGPCPPLSLPGKGALRPEDAWSAGLLLSEKARPCRSSGFGWVGSVLARCAA